MLNKRIPFLVLITFINGIYAYVYDLICTPYILINFIDTTGKRLIRTEIYCQSLLVVRNTKLFRAMDNLYRCVYIKRSTVWYLCQLLLWTLTIFDCMMYRLEEKNYMFGIFILLIIKQIGWTVNIHKMCLLIFLLNSFF